MSILYICDRCGDTAKDGSTMRCVALCNDDYHASDFGMRCRVGTADSSRMLCRRCISQVQATITEQLPQVKL